MGKDEKRFSNSINIKNRKARFEFEFLDTLVAGIMLTGSEIKSIREGKASLQEGYCYFKKNALFIKGMNISPYEQATHYNHDPVRERKLLLNKNELEKWQSKLEEKGLTVVPVRLFLNNKGLAKLEIALAKGKKLYDKRDSIKERDTKREMDRLRF